MHELSVADNDGNCYLSISLLLMMNEIYQAIHNLLNLEAQLSRFITCTAHILNTSKIVLLLVTIAPVWQTIMK